MRPINSYSNGEEMLQYQHPFTFQQDDFLIDRPCVTSDPSEGNK